MNASFGWVRVSTLKFYHTICLFLFILHILVNFQFVLIPEADPAPHRLIEI